MESPDPIDTVRRFDECIAARDVDGLSGLMIEDHCFIDPAGGIVRGKPACLNAWRSFFNAFPDYRNRFARLEVRGQTVVATGHSESSDIRLAGPAIWLAKIHDGHVTEWRVMEDTETNRRQLGLQS